MVRRRIAKQEYVVDRFNTNSGSVSDPARSLIPIGETIPDVFPMIPGALFVGVGGHIPLRAIDEVGGHSNFLQRFAYRRAVPRKLVLCSKDAPYRHSGRRPYAGRAPPKCQSNARHQRGETSNWDFI